MKKILSFVLALTLILALTACGKEASSSFTPTIRVDGETANVAFPLEKADEAALRTMLEDAAWTAAEDYDTVADVILFLDDPDVGMEVSLDGDTIYDRAEGKQAPLSAEMEELIRAIIGESQVDSMSALCETAVAMLPEDVVLFKASTEEVMNAIPGLADIDYQELCAYFPAVYGYGCEIVMISVDEADVAATEQIFKDYVAEMSDDTDYPENAEGWKNNATVSVSGTIVTLCCLPEGVVVPDILLGK